MDDEYLIHYGVKGMKWGVRRARRKEARKAKSAARLDFKAERQLENSKNSMTSWRRNANKKAYQKTIEKRNRKKAEVSKESFKEAKQKVAKFRSTAYSLAAANSSTYKVLNPLTAAYQGVTIAALASTGLFPAAVIGGMAAGTAAGLGVGTIKARASTSAYSSRRNYYKNKSNK